LIIDPIVEKITATDVPDGAIWMALHKKDGQMQVVKKSYEKAKESFRAMTSG